jgi:hypothetical protein
MPNEDEGVQSTYEEATRCPRCALPGDVTGKAPAAKRGYQVHTVYCRNKDCSWFDSMWIVQVNPDGSVPQPNTAKPREADKLYPSLQAPPEEEQRILAALERQVSVEVKPGGEVRNRHG